MDFYGLLAIIGLNYKVKCEGELIHSLCKIHHEKNRRIFYLIPIRWKINVKPQAAVFEVISRQLSLPSDAFSLETPLEELGIDSLKAITILYELEDLLNIEVPNEVFDSIKNVGDIVQQLKQLTTSSDTAC